MRPLHTHPSGISFVDVIVGTALLSIGFMGLFGGFKLSLALNAVARERAGAFALAQERMEHIRSLPYAQVGTQGGIPSGDLLQEEVLTLNSIPYSRRTFVQYYDAPEDGLGALDENGITADYKLLKVELSWSSRGLPRSFVLLGSMAPPGIESIEGGGTLTISVIDALSQHVSGATVSVVNETANPPIDTTTFSNASGFVQFPGAPAASSYALWVSKPGHSQAGTYDAGGTNPNPVPAHVTVTEGATTAMTFAIDALATLTLNATEPTTPEMYSEAFSSGVGLGEMAGTALASGALELASPGGAYVSSGYATTTLIAPPSLASWGELASEETVPVGTSVTYQLFYETSPGVFAPVPESDLPGNAAGIQTLPRTLSALSASTYPSLGVRMNLESTDALATPRVETLSLTYERAASPVPGASFTLIGSKTIGTGADGAPVYKIERLATTGASGSATLSDLEWDTYTIAAHAPYSIASACPFEPFTLAPGSNTAVTLILMPASAHALRVTVADSSGAPLAHASVSLSGPGYAQERETNACGNAFFGGLAESAYALTVSMPGHASYHGPELSVSGNDRVQVTLESE